MTIYIKEGVRFYYPKGTYPSKTTVLTMTKEAEKVVDPEGKVLKDTHGTPSATENEGQRS